MSDYLCNLIVPGAAKSGTSSLHGILSRHPNVAMSRPKEPQFFSFDDLYSKGFNYHNSLFEDADVDTSVYGESSQSYFVHQRAIDRIQKSLDKPKIIILLRDPLERLLSHYRWNYKLAVETASLESALQERGDDTSYSFDPKVNMYRENGGYLAFSRYSKYVPRWKSVFGDENVLLLRTDDLKSDQQGVASACFRFLGLNDHLIEEKVRQNSTSTTTRLFDSRPWYLSAPASILPESIKQAKLYHKVRTKIFELLTPSPPESIPPSLRRYVSRELEEDMAFYSRVSCVGSG